VLHTNGWLLQTCVGLLAQVAPLMRPRVVQSTPPRLASSAAPLKTVGDAEKTPVATETAMTANWQREEDARIIGKLLLNPRVSGAG